MKSFYLEDPSRNEKDLGHDVYRTRRLEVNVHYPAKQSRAPAYKVDPNMEELVTPDPLKKEKFDNLWTRSQPGLEPSTQEKFPVVVFSHGYGTNHNDYQHLVEELASHGFCVITINHPHSNFGVTFLGNFQDVRHLDMMEMLDKKGDEKGQDQVVDREVMTNAQDIEFVIDQIKKGEIEDFQKLLGTSIDLDSIGVFGHSMGGAASLQVCQKMPQVVKAGVNIDGAIFVDPEKEKAMDQPFLFIAAGEQKESPMGWDHFIKEHPQTSRKVIVPHASHMDFSIASIFRAINEEMPLEKRIERMEEKLAHLKNVEESDPLEKEQLTITIQVLENHLKTLKEKRFVEINRKANDEIVPFFKKYLK